MKTPKNARVKSVHASLEPNDVVRLATKWVSPQFGSGEEGHHGDSQADSSFQPERPQARRSRHNRPKPLDVRKLFPKQKRESATSRRTTSPAGWRSKMLGTTSAAAAAAASCGEGSRQPLGRLCENTSMDEGRTQQCSDRAQENTAVTSEGDHGTQQCSDEEEEDDSLTQLVTSLSLDATTVAPHHKNTESLCDTVHGAPTRIQPTAELEHCHTYSASGQFESSKFKPPSASTPYHHPSLLTACASDNDASYRVRNATARFDVSQVKTRDCTLATYHSATATSPGPTLHCDDTELQSEDTHQSSDSEQTCTHTSLPLSQWEESHTGVECDPDCSQSSEVSNESFLAKETPAYLWFTPVPEQKVRAVEDTLIG